MTEEEQTGGLTAAAGILMALVLLWSGGLAAGFTYAAFSGSAHPTFARSAGYLAIAFFLALLAARTGYEVVRRLSAGRRTGRAS